VARKKTVAVPLMSYRCATCGKAFTSYRSLGAHSVSHSKKWRAGRKAAMQKAAQTKAARRKAGKKQ
jgi:predicted nucleic acid-binding Zn ribbon protein